jgi:DNA-binding NarL/FixJ family response regulator
VADAKIRVLLADDHSLVRRGFRRLLEDDEAIEVVGEAANGDEAIAMTATLRPAVVVMDVAMPGTNGLAAGERVLDPGVNRRTALKGERTHALTPRELEVLQLICAGLSNREIADQLGLSVNTVAVHRANIMSALGVHKTAELVVYAITNGLVTLP